MFYDKACELKSKDIIVGIKYSISSYLKLCLEIKDSYGYENPYDKPLKIINKEEIEAIIADANATADKHLQARYNSAKVEAKQLSDKVVEWLQAKPVSNGLAILLAVLIIIID